MKSKFTVIVSIGIVFLVSAGVLFDFGLNYSAMASGVSGILLFTLAPLIVSFIEDEKVKK